MKLPFYGVDAFFENSGEIYENSFKFAPRKGKSGSIVAPNHYFQDTFLTQNQPLVCANAFTEYEQFVDAAFRDSLYGATDLFLAVFDLNHAFAYGSYFGGNNYDFGPCMTITENGFYFAGSTTSFQDIATPDAFQAIYGGGNREAFIQVFSGIALNKENSYSQVNLFPNPAHSSFSIDASSLIESFRILSLTGDQVYCSPFCKSKNVRFDCSRLDKGCYLVEIQTEKEVSVTKVIVDN